MFSRRNKIVLFITLLLFLSLACEFTRAEEDLPEVNSEDAIATSVAATIAANQVGEDPVESADPTVHPTVTASAPEPNFNYAGVSFYFNEALAENIVAGVNPAEIIDNTWWNTPEHREYRFTDWVLADSFLEARIKIYPVEGFLDVNPGVGGNIDALKLALTTKPTDGEGAPVVDIFNAARMYTSNVAYLQFQNGEGIRFLTQYGQAVSPLGWPMMFYTFQGITDDGRYLVSAMLPATHPSLPHPDQVTMDQAFMDNWETYVAETEALLNAELDNSFLPPLALLDGMIESLMVGEP